MLELKPKVRSPETFLYRCLKTLVLLVRKLTDVTSLSVRKERRLLKHLKILG